MTAGQAGDDLRRDVVSEAAEQRHRRMATANPASMLSASGGRAVEVKAHRCLWSGDYPENSLPAIEECFRELVSRAEIDLHMLRDADFLVLHDSHLDASTNGTGRTGDLSRGDAEALRLRAGGRVTSEKPPLFSEVVSVIADQPSCTLLELDIPDLEPIPWPRVEELVAIVEPIRDKVHVNASDWNARRVLAVNSDLQVGIDPGSYLDWVPSGQEDGEVSANSVRNSYGYFDQHVLGSKLMGLPRHYLFDRLGGLLRLVPGAAEIHLRADLLDKILDDGFPDVIGFLHDRGLLVDAWTINAGRGSWMRQLRRVVDAGADIISSDTPRELTAAWDRFLHTGGSAQDPRRASVSVRAGRPHR